MSHYRNLGGGKRDSNEPQIMKRFRSHGWRVEQISGNRLWDLLVIPPKHSRAFSFGCQSTGLVDVKQTDGEVTPAQAKKWKDLRADGIPIYVVRTADDVDAMVRGALEPWEPEATHRPKAGDAAKAREYGRQKMREHYTPPRSTPVDAAKEAEATFAPTDLETRECGCIGRKHTHECMVTGRYA